MKLFDRMRDLPVHVRLTGFSAFMILLLVVGGIAGVLGVRTVDRVLTGIHEAEIRDLEALRRSELFFLVRAPRLPREVREGRLAPPAAAGEIDRGLSGVKALAAAGEAGGLDRAAEVLRDLGAALRAGDQRRIQRLEAAYLELLPEVQAGFEARFSRREAAAKDRHRESEALYRRIRAGFALLALLGVAAGVVAAGILIADIKRPLALLVNAMRGLREGDFSTTLPYERNDEFRELVDGYNATLEYLAELLTEIQKSGISVNSSVTELSATSREQESSASELAATCSEIAASSTEIAATSARLLETMKGVAELASETAEAAGEGHEGLSRIDETISRMESATGSIVSKLGVLSEKAGNIAGVVKTINKVADQTNLLSLNAAIEAEKAGEYGAGFAVVATEIRRLADQTAVATYDIEQMVQEVQSAVSSGVMGMDKFAEDVRGSVKEIRRIGATLSEVIQRVQALTPHIEEVNEGMVSQSQGAQQISDAIMQLNESVQQMAASLVQTGETVNQLRDVAVGLRESVSRFRVEG
ncbi:methyl-accepting chemotaxis protein [Dissulfurirhabdus thermomarina]|uniref:Methyl-accepting chemotaxis protein n=1 Tax=Dissulfurirhabdus thermomarina TaxID=1765737 RepID=A0A6N9TRM0_DISTH|nr:methyl-accepting chemotaxis protein [Dissulfurirhabdus thermomarina]NDY42404.1 methyl-accepting chemotaxis protein [Dissulfurirhabdus thermomarina]NMX23226.1 methyl-accepting chemotaxis protein [Dissulfurirhabdus thermomarina]